MTHLAGRPQNNKMHRAVAAASQAALPVISNRSAAEEPLPPER